MEDKLQADKTKAVDARLYPGATPPEAEAAAPVEVTGALADNGYSIVFVSQDIREMMGQSRRAGIDRTGTLFVDMGTRKLKYEPIPDKEVTEFNDDVLDGAIGRLQSVNDKTLLMLIVIIFTENNNANQLKRGGVIPKVSFSVDMYAHFRGMTPVTPGRRKEAARRVRESLENLSNLTITYNDLQENQKAGDDFTKYRIIGSHRMRKGWVTVTLDYGFYEALVRNNIVMCLPDAWGRIDARQPNASAIGFSMAKHYYDKRNTKNYNRLRVETILGYSELPSIEHIRRTRQSFPDKIREPLERSLNYLVEEGVLTYWHYTDEKGECLTDKEVNKLPYEPWAEMRIFYGVDGPDRNAINNKALLTEGAADN